MKSSTLKRSTLSKENMEVIEALAKEADKDNSLGEYYRSDESNSETVSVENDFTSKAQEIDLLWQNFKSTQLNSNSPTAYVLIGFIAGIVVTILSLFVIGTVAQKTGKLNVAKLFTPVQQVQFEEQTLEQQARDVEDTTVSVPTDEEETSLNSEDDSKQITEQSVIENTSPVNQTSEMKKYIVKSGDTGESIIKHFYGAYTPERAQKIIKANNLKSLDRINIDQELLIPVE